MHFQHYERKCTWEEEGTTMKRWLLVAICFFIAGCATVPPVMHDVQSTGTFNAKYEGIAGPVKEFFDKEKIPVKKGTDDRGMIETEEMKVPYEGFQYVSDYCDCGALGGLYVYHEILGKFNAVIKETDNSNTTMHISASYKASLWWHDTFIGWVECQSKGYIEGKLIAYVNDALNRKKK